VRLTRIYTKTGDQGETGLVGGQRVPKDSDRIEAYGTVDELNACLGIIRSFLKEIPNRELIETVDPRIAKIQNLLFIVGSDLATPPGVTPPNRVYVQEKQVVELEHWMDAWQADLKPLPEFILPGGGKIASLLHLARTVCRRAERLAVRLSRKEQVGPEVVRYLNRLSDTFFVLARWVSLKLGEKEVLWDRNVD
jgi:cob(I)alamin adenosyltransferase